MSSPGYLQSTFLSAKEAYKSGRFDVAERLCQEILSVNALDVGARSLLGLVAGQTQRPEMAIQLLSGVLQVNPNSWGVLNALSVILRQEGRRKEALVLRDRALELKPDDANGHNERGLCLLEMSDPDQAVICFRRAIALDPAIPIHYFNLGTALSAIDRGVEAVHVLQKAHAMAPNDPRIATSLGNVCLYLGRREEGVNYLRRAYEMAPDTVEGKLNLARALAEHEDLPEASDLLAKLISEHSDRYDVQMQAGVLYVKMGRFEEARGPLLRAMELRPDEIDPYNSFVDTKKIGEEDAPIVAKMDRIGSNPELYDAEAQKIQFCLGKAYNDLGEYESAIRHFDLGNAAAERILRARRGPFDREIQRTGVDFLIRNYTRELFEQRPIRESDSDLPILIVGMPRSGTTLTEQIISSHSQVAAGGELSYWFDRACEFHVQKRVPTDHELDKMASEYVRMLQSIGPTSARVTDKNPMVFNAVGLVRASLPNARIIHCRRNPVDTCLSIYMTRLGAMPQYGHNRENIVFMYREYLRLVEHWRQALPKDSYLEVDYESLTEDPEAQSRRLIEFCGLEWEDACLSHDRNARIVSTPSLWQVRQPIYKRSVERWRNYEPWLGAFAELLDQSQVDPD